jgi:arsenate reductase
MAQLLAAVAAQRAGIAARTFSAGTEATAFNPRAIAALGRAGFEISGEASVPNPRYQVRWSPTEPPIEAFSKTLEDPSLPSSGFVAVMTCSQADAACPFVKGASARVAVPYEDPKVADGTPEEAQRYDERVEQIGRDLTWVFRQLALG